MAEPAPRSIDLHDRLAQFILAEVTIVITSPPGKVGFEDGQSTRVLQFAGCPHCHLALTQITPVTIDQPYQARDAITSESRSGAIADLADTELYGAFQR